MILQIGQFFIFVEWDCAWRGNAWESICEQIQAFLSMCLFFCLPTNWPNMGQAKQPVVRRLIFVEHSQRFLKYSLAPRVESNYLGPLFSVLVVNEDCLTKQCPGEKSTMYMICACGLVSCGRQYLCAHTVLWGR
jgi:hypothetical protein